MIVNLPDGRKFRSKSNDPEEARREAREFLAANPAPTPAPNNIEAAPAGVGQVREESEGVIQEIGEGIVSGGIGIVQGVSELVASAVDLAVDTNYASDVTEFADEIRRAGGIDPVGFAGKGTEILTQFVVPGFAAAKAISGATKLGKLARSGEELSTAQKAGLAAEQIAAASAADVIVATDGITTIGDFFDGGPTTTDQTMGLQGREEAWRRITNKFKVGTETGAIVAVAPTVLSGAMTATGAVAGKVSDAAAPYASTAAKTVRESKPVQNTKDYLDRIEAVRIENPDEQGFVQNTLADALASLRYRGMLPEEAAAQRAVISGITDAEARQAQRTLAKLDETLKPIIDGQSDLVKTQIVNNIEAFLDPHSVKAYTAEARKALLDEIPLEVRPIVQEMRNHIDDLSKSILDSDFIKRLKEVPITSKKGKNAGKMVGDVVEDTIEKNLNTYLRRRFAAELDPNYKPDAEVMAEAVKGFKNDVKTTVEYLKKARKKGGVSEGQSKKALGLSDDGKNVVGLKVTDAQADVAARQYLKEFKSGLKPSGTKQDPARVSLEKIQTGMFKARERLPEYQRKLLGEIRDPEEAYLGTIADLAEFKAVDKFYGRIRELAEKNEGLGKYFIRRESDTDFVPPDYVVLGQASSLAGAAGKKGKGLPNISWGSLEGYAVPRRIYKDLTRAVKQDLGPSGNLIRATYSSFLRAKGFSQYGKTVLSPITQIRNVTSAALFAMAQGNVGRGANLWDSIGLVRDDLLKKTTDMQMAELRELQELGVIGSQAELQELRRLIDEGYGTPGLLDEAASTRLGAKVAQRISRSKGGEFLVGAGKKIKRGGKYAEDAYQGGDNIWKIYNYKFEQNKLLSAFDDISDADKLAYAQSKGFDDFNSFVKNESATIVKNTVPNYNLAPEFITTLRKLPVGNFIAFPYEIMRTGINTIAKGVEELASDIPGIQKIGLRRLTGATTTFAIFPAALTEMAHRLSGVTEEEMQAFKRSLAAPWEKNARLIPTGRDKNGLPTYINYSYTNPYDMLERVVHGAINKYEEGKTLGKGPGEAVSEAAWESFTELFSPFFDESIITAKMLDVLPTWAAGRGGRTETGARVYNPQETRGEQIARSMLHVMDGLVPSLAPVDLSGNGVEAGRFTRSFLTATGINELIGVSEKDRQGRERQFAGEIIRALTGVTENTINPDMSLKYKGYEYARARQDSSNIFNRVARSLNLTDPEELLEAYKSANNARFRATNKFHQVIQDMQELGLSKSQVRRILKEANVGGIDEIIRGRYEPLEISDPVEEDMRRIGTYRLLPRNEIRQIQREDRRRMFGEEEEEPTQAPTPPQTQAPTPPQTQAPLVSQSPVSTSPQLLSQSNNATSPILNPDPTTRALAEELERRRG